MTDLLEQALPYVTDLCKEFEGFRAAPYLCPAGKWTRGYGTVYKLDGVRVKATDPPIDEPTAALELQSLLRSVYLPAVVRLCPSINKPHTLAAIGDFAFNLGVSALANSTLRLRINAGRWEDVSFELRRWINANGVPSNGLRRRREAEVALIAIGGGL